jgi:tRNA G18 (ribose-2'-O)-methylase SpoU
VSIRNMENPHVNYKKIIMETNSKMFNVKDEYKDNTVEENQFICHTDSVRFSVGVINVTGDLNIGMMLRTASLLGARNFYIFGRKKFDKRSTVGAENYINIIHHTYEDPINADVQLLADIRTLAQNNRILLCEHGGRELGYDNSAFYSKDTRPPLFLFGSESHGIPELITKQKVDSEYDMGWNYEFERISIPQRGVLRSFNVSAACSIILWDYCREWLNY